MKFFSFGKSKKNKGSNASSVESLNAINNKDNIYSDVKIKELGKLHKAAWNNEIDKVRELSKKEVNTVDKQNRTALHLAASRGHSESVKILLEWGANENCCDGEGHTPLYRAVEAKSVDCVRALIHEDEAVARSNLPSELLFLAVELGDVQIAGLLLHNGSQINSPNKNGDFLSHVAAKKKDLSMLELLVKKPALVDKRNGENLTPLMICCANGFSKGVAALLNESSDTKIVNKEGLNALQIANQAKHYGCVTLITNYYEEHGILISEDKIETGIGGVEFGETLPDDEDSDTHSEVSKQDLDTWKSDSRSETILKNVAATKKQSTLKKEKKNDESVEQLLVTLNNKEKIESVTSITPQGPNVLRLTNSSGSLNYPVVLDRRRRTSGTPTSARSRSMSPSSVVMSRASRASSIAGENENVHLKPSSPLHTKTKETADNDESEWDSTKDLSLSLKSNRTPRGVIQRQESEWDDISSVAMDPVNLSAKKDKQTEDDSTWDSESKLDLTVVETPRWNNDSYMEEKKKSQSRTPRKSESDWDSSITNEISSPVVPTAVVKSTSVVDLKDVEEIMATKAFVEITAEEVLAPINEEKSLNSSEGDQVDLIDNKVPHFSNIQIDKFSQEEEDWDSTLSEDIPGLPTDRSITSPRKKQTTALDNSVELKTSASSSSASSKHISKPDQTTPLSRPQTNNQDERAAALSNFPSHESYQLPMDSTEKISADKTRFTEDGTKNVDQDPLKESTSLRKERAKRRLEAYQNSGSKVSYDSDNSAIDSVQDSDFTSPLGSYINGILEGGDAEVKETARAAKAAYRMKLAKSEDGLSYSSSSESVSLPKAKQASSTLAAATVAGLNAPDKVKALEREIAMLQSRVKSTNMTAQQLEELQKRYDEARNQLQSAEQDVLDLTTQLQRQMVHVQEEEQKRKNAENMLLRTKAQLDLKEEECYKEQTERHKTELDLRSVHVDLESVRQKEKRVQLERDDLHRQLEQERETRFAMEREFHQEQQKLRSSLRESKEEQQPARSSDSARTVAIEEAYKRLKSESSENLASELNAYRSELERMRNRLKDEREKWIAENDELRNQVENLAQEAKLNEEALGSASLSYNYQINALQDELHALHAQLDKHRDEQQQLRLKLGQTQIDLVQAAAASQSHANGHDVAQAEASLQCQLEDYMREWNEKLEVREQELLELRQTNRALLEKVTSAETRISAVELEMKRAQGVATQRGVQVKNLRFELSRQNQEREELLKDKKMTDEENVRLQTRIESLNDKLNDVQNSNVAQQQQVQSLINSLGIKENHEVHENLISILQVIRNDHEKNKHELQDRHSNLSHELIELRTELRNAHQHIERDEAQLHILRQEHTSAIKKLSHVEADLAFTKQSKSGLENELWKVKQEVETLRKVQQQYEQQAERNATRLEGVSSSRSDHQLTALIDRIEQVEVKSLSTSKTQLPQWKQEDYEERLRHQEVKNQRLLNSVENETQRNEALHRDLSSTKENEQNRRNDVEADLTSQQALWEKESINMNKLNLRAYVDNNFVERNQLDRYQLELRNEAQNEVTEKLDQVNRYLQDQAKARESIDRVRDEVEDKLRKDFEHRRKEMQMEIEALRRTCADLQSDRDQVRNDLMRLSTAYDQECRLRSKLADRLEWVNNEAAASQAALSLEKERFHSLSTSNLYLPTQQMSSVSRVPWTTIDGPSSISSTILEHRLRQELQRSISKQVEAGDSGPILLSQPVVQQSEVVPPKSLSPAVSEPTTHISRPIASPPHSHLGFVTKDPLSPSTLRLARHKNALHNQGSKAGLTSAQFLNMNGSYEPSDMDLSYLGFLKRKFLL